MRQTSIDVYNYLKNNGLLSKRRWEIYEIMFKHGPMTSAETFKFLNQNDPMKNITQSRARFTELRDMGIFYEVQERNCTITGHKVIEWDITSNFPNKIAKPLTKIEEIKKLKAFLNEKGLIEEYNKYK